MPMIPVTDVVTLQAALNGAKAGDEIVLADGTYAVAAGQKLACSASGTTSAPIIVRAATLLGAKIELSTLEGFTVTGASWHFEGLDLKGVCAADKDCEHAIHVSGNAPDFQLRKSRVVDFNAQLKVNASAKGAGIPHAGIVEGNELFDTHPRDTNTPVTKLNIDTGDGWVVRGNYIHDYQRKDGSTTYGAFMKSGGKNGLFERNLVLCTKDQAETGAGIGLSFGGGGTGNEFCAPAFDASKPCSVEHEGGVLRNNIIAHCSDVGIYLNRAKGTKVLYNTLVETNGVDFRFDTTSGEAHGNVLSGKVRDRDGATHTASDELEEVSADTFAAMYVAPLRGDLTKKGDLAALIGKGAANPDVTDDYCLRARVGTFDLGALQHSLGDCSTKSPPFGGASGGPGPGSSGEEHDGGSAWPDGWTDGGASPATPPDEDSGCSASGAGSSAPLGLVAFSIVLGFLRRRRTG